MRTNSLVIATLLSAISYLCAVRGVFSGIAA